MDIQHHPHDELLVAFAAGDLEEAWALLIATHLALCPSCRTQVRAAEAMGAAFLDEAPATAMADGALDQVLARATRPETEAAPRSTSPPSPPTSSVHGAPLLPRPLRDYAPDDVGSLKWRRLGPNLRHVPLISAPGAPTARLLRLSAGKAVSRHGHNGLELTLVLAGSLVDGEKHFVRGDIETANAEVEHQPVAGSGEDCVCLAVTDAPLRFKGIFARLTQPFLGI